MKPEAKSGFVPGHRRLVSPPANSCRTSRERDATFARESWLRRSFAKPVWLTCPLDSSVTWNGAIFPPLTPKTTGSGFVEVEADAPHAANVAAIATSTASLHTLREYRAPLKAEGGLERSSPPGAAASRFGPVVLRALGAVGTNSEPVSARHRGRPARDAPWRVGQSHRYRPLWLVRGTNRGRPRRTNPDASGHPARPGDDAAGKAAYLAKRGQEVACATTQGALSSH